MNTYLLTLIVLAGIAAVFGLAFVLDRALRRLAPCPKCATDRGREG